MGSSRFLDIVLQAWAAWAAWEAGVSLCQMAGFFLTLVECCEAFPNSGAL